VTPINARCPRFAAVPRNQNSGFIVIARALFRHCRRVDSYDLMRPTRIGALLVTLIVSSRARSRPMFPRKRRLSMSW
jgi:hypothetical protein